ncbi:hypothetical protein [Gimesia sp.]|uniref:hypothetical protein n=1 Tax=Gimesia sp. TaxID=2024833 RepID=UPI003A9391C4
MKPRYLLSGVTRSCFNAEYIAPETLLAVGNRKLYEFKGQNYSETTILYSSESRLYSLGTHRDSPVKVIVGDLEGRIHFPETDLAPVKAIGGVVFACGIKKSRDSSECTIIAAGHDGVQDMGWGGNVRLIRYNGKTLELGKNYEFEWTPKSLCIARKSNTIIVGCGRGEIVNIDLDTDTRKTFRVEGSARHCVLSHDENLLAVDEYESVTVRRVADLEDVIARFPIQKNEKWIHTCIRWHPSQPEVLMIAEAGVGIKLLNVFSPEIQLIKNPNITEPTTIWFSEHDHTFNILQRDWRFMTMKLKNQNDH